MARCTRFVGLTMAAILALGACGGDDEDSSDDTVTLPEDEGSEGREPADDGEEADGAGDDEADDADAGEVDAGDVDACAALDGVDLDALLGQPSGAPVDESTGMGGACSFAPAGGGSGGGSLAVTTSRSAENYDNQADLLGVDAEVEGLGDRAFHTGPYLFVLDGDRLVRLQVLRDASTGSPAVPDEDMESAAMAILANLG